jgi:AcrR family transcriptional regulator
MRRTPERRSPGRPARGTGLSEDKVLSAALALLEQEGLAGLSMRALARTLAVDPMALYHYFPDRQALLRALSAKLYASLQVPAPHSSNWKANLEQLGLAYLGLLGKYRELLLHLSTHPALADASARRFDAHFRAALAGQRLRAVHYKASQGAFVDFVHGYSLALRSDKGGQKNRAFRQELGVLLRGIEALLE